MKTIFAMMMAAIMALSLALPVAAQDAGPPPEAGVYRSSEELDQLVAPIALYPDPLIAQILPAATQPADVVTADRYLQSGGDPNQVDAQPWDPSVKAMAHYPDILKWMDDNLTWTTQLGQAFLGQQSEVMDAVQRMRAQAQSLGNLVSTPQQQVVVTSGVIEVLPVEPEVIYVPYYDPAYVYYQRPVFDRPWITFSVGWPIGLWFDHDCDWRDHGIFVWHRDHPRPHDWWGRPPEQRFHTERGGFFSHSTRTVVNENVSVWRPRPVHPFTDATRAARGYDVQATHLAPNRPVERPLPPRVTERPTPSHAQPAPTHIERPPTERPIQRPPAERPGVGQRPIERPPAERPTVEQRPVQRPTTTERPPAVTRPPVVERQAPRVIEHPATVTQRPVPPASGALIGVHSARDTQIYTTRGQTSRGVAPAPAPHPAPAPAPHPAPAPPSHGSNQDRHH